MHVMAESNVPITRVSNIKMLVAFARKGNKLKQTNSKKKQQQKTDKQRQKKQRERGREGRGGSGGSHCNTQQALKVKANYFLN